jgi:hypothetical protein
MENLSNRNIKDIQESRANRLAPENITTKLVCLNFKVPMRIRQQFKIAAARHNMTMTELLLHLVNDFMNAPLVGNRQHELPTQQEIKK